MMHPMPDATAPPIDDVAARVTAVLLAAGAGSRFRAPGHKLAAALAANAPRPDETVAARACASAVAAFGSVTDETGALVEDELGIEAPADVSFVDNPRWSSGQASSVQVGLEAARQAGATIVVIGLGDQPGIQPESWRRVAESSTPHTPIAVATYEGRRANPVALHRRVWDDVADTGDQGARSLMALRPDDVVEVPCSGSPDDIDTVEDLSRWQNN